MTTSDRTDDLITRMLRERADADVPIGLLDGAMHRVATTPQARRGFGLERSLPAGRTARVAVVLAAALVLVGLAIGGVLAARLLDAPTTPPPSMPAVIVVPSTSPSASSDTGVLTPEPSVTSQPSVAPRGTPAAVVTPAWTLPDGWRYDLRCEESEDGTPDCVLHVFDATGLEADGWPVHLGGDCWGGVAIGPNDSLFVPCVSNSSVVVNGLDRVGTKLTGWPVRFAGDDASVAVDPQGTVYIGVGRYEPMRYTLHALAPDGSERSGSWPKTLPGGAQGFTLAPDGTVVAWWYEGIAEGAGDLAAQHTVFMMYRANGNALAGWPKRSDGAATSPVVWTDGSIFYTSATAKVWGLNRAGERISGWPYQLSSIVAPEVRSDGRLLFVGDSRVDLLTRSGKAVPGWPYRTTATFLPPGCDTGGQAPGSLFTRTSDDRLYLAAWDGERGSIIALDANGGIADGWPYRIPAGWRPIGLILDAQGVLRVDLASDPDCGGGMDDTSIQLAPSGRLASDPPPTPLPLVYAALRLSPLRTSTGTTSFEQGAPIGFAFQLVNQSKRDVMLPLVDYYGASYYAAGTVQTWIERLGPDTRLKTCLPNAGRKGTWYATGGWINVTDRPMTIGPGESMVPTLSTALDADLTGCLPAGSYRFHVEYKPLDGDDEEVIEARALDILVTPAAGSSPAPTPTWTPSPSPAATRSPVPTQTPTSPPVVPPSAAGSAP